MSRDIGRDRWAGPLGWPLSRAVRQDRWTGPSNRHSLNWPGQHRTGSKQSKECRKGRYQAQRQCQDWLNAQIRGDGSLGELLVQKTGMAAMPERTQCTNPGWRHYKELLHPLTGMRAQASCNKNAGKSALANKRQEQRGTTCCRDPLFFAPGLPLQCRDLLFLHLTCPGNAAAPSFTPDLSKQRRSIGRDYVPRRN